AGVGVGDRELTGAETADPAPTSGGGRVADALVGRVIGFGYETGRTAPPWPLGIAATAAVCEPVMRTTRVRPAVSHRFRFRRWPPKSLVSKRRIGPRLSSGIAHPPEILLQTSAHSARKVEASPERLVREKW